MVLGKKIISGGKRGDNVGKWLYKSKVKSENLKAFARNAVKVQGFYSV